MESRLVELMTKETVGKSTAEVAIIMLRVIRELEIQRNHLIASAGKTPSIAQAQAAMQLTRVLNASIIDSIKQDELAKETEAIMERLRK